MGLMVSFYRRINAIFPQKAIKVAVLQYVSHVALTSFVLLTLILAYVFMITFGEYRQLSQQQNENLQKLSYWEKVLSDRPQYPAAYFEAALYAAKLNQPQKAIEYLQRVLVLDPNFKEARDFAEKLGKR